MSNWRLAESLKALRAQINAAFPDRSKVSDGTIGDAAHASRKSDHNPWVKSANGLGVVTAIDITHDPRGGVNCHELATALVQSRDPRIKYLIWSGRITKKATLPAWMKYHGANPHNHHLHVSVSSDPTLYDSPNAWNVKLNSHPSEKEVEKLFAQPVLKKGDKGETVKMLQAALKIEADGVFGKKTEQAVTNYQFINKLKNDGIVGPNTWNLLLKR